MEKNRKNYTTNNNRQTRYKTCRFLTQTKQGLRANGFSLLPLALRPGLVLAMLLTMFGSLFINILYNPSVSASSVTLTVPSSALSLEIKPNSGTVFQKSSPATISIATDSSYGYSLSIHSKNSDSDSSKSNDLLNGSNKISSIVSTLSESDFQNSGENNTWGYLPSKLNSSVNSDFQPGPTTEPTTLDITESSSEGTNYDITLATKIDNTLPAGTYHNSFVLTAVSNEPAFDNLMQGETGYGWTGCDDLGEEETIELIDTRDNRTYSVAKLKDGNCWMTQNLRIAGKTLTAEDSDVLKDFNLPSSMSSNFSDYNNPQVHIETDGGYYNWSAATAGEGKSSITSVEVTQSICPKGWRLPSNAEITALASAYDGSYSKISAEPANFTLSGYFTVNWLGDRDLRGYYWSSTAGSDKPYACLLYLDTSSANSSSNVKAGGYSVRCVARPDNPKKVGTMQTVEEWGDSVEQGETVVSEDIRDGKRYTVTRLSDGKLWMTKNLALGKDDSETKLTSEDSDVGTDFTLPNSTTSGFSSYDTSYIYVADNEYGGYYSWFAATAGEGTQYGLTSGDAQHSICPKGWRLPTQTEFSTLVTNLGGTSSAGATALQNSTNNFKKGGYYNSGSPVYVGSYGYYWSSTAYPSYYSNYAYVLYLNDSSISPAYNDNKKNYGQSVRCVSRTDDPLTMQNVSEWKDSVKDNQEIKAIDTRDNKEYTVARLKDGNLWMTQNLAIGSNDSTKTLNPEDSDLPETTTSYTLHKGSTNGFNDNSAEDVYIGAETYNDDSQPYAGYYTYNAATAGTGKSISYGEATGSICPRGWRLPTRSENQNLISAYNKNADGELLMAPANFVLSGYYGQSSLNNGGKSSALWTSTASNDGTGGYVLSLTNSSAGAPDYYRGSGLAVRCIAR